MACSSKGDMAQLLLLAGLGSTDFKTNPIFVKFDPKAVIMLGTTFVKVVCWDSNTRSYSATSWT